MSTQTPDKTLSERLEAAAKRRELAAKKVEDALELAEVEAEEKAAELEEKHGAGKVAKVTTDAGPFVLLRPPGLAWETWQRACVRAGKNEVPQKEIDKFINQSIEYPPNFKAILEERPAIQTVLGVELSRLYGSKALEDMGK